MAKVIVIKTDDDIPAENLGNNVKVVIDGTEYNGMLSAVMNYVEEEPEILTATVQGELTLTPKGE